jgi:hypothetical protein
MKSIELKDRSVVIELSDRELILINNALNEVCNGIDVPEFETRLGGTTEEASQLHREIGKELKKLEPKKE